MSRRATTWPTPRRVTTRASCGLMCRDRKTHPGPSSLWGPLEDLTQTDQPSVLIQTAKRSIIVVTFAAYKVPNIAAALVIGARRGVKIALILETSADSDGAVTFNA